MEFLKGLALQTEKQLCINTSRAGDKEGKVSTFFLGGVESLLGSLC